MQHIHLIGLLALFFPAVAQAQLSPDAWRRDIQVLRTELPKRHATMFANLPQAEYDVALQNLTANLEGKSDLDIALDIQTTLARVGDVFTYLDMTPVLQRAKVIPIGFGWYADGLYVSGTIKRFEPALGGKVLKINGLDASEAIRRLHRYVPMENSYTPRKEALQWLRFPDVYRRVGIGNSDTLNLLLEDASGKRFTYPVYAFDFKTATPVEMMPAQLPRNNPDLRWQPIQSIYALHWLAADSIVYFQWNACLSREMALEDGDTLSADQLPPFQYYADSVFSLLQQYPGARLFIDLRFNGGGGASDGKRLAERLKTLPGINRPDKIYVAVNLYTALAAVEVAHYFNTHTAATLLGEPPAQRPDHYGGMKVMSLPGSRLDVRYSTAFPTTPLAGPVASDVLTLDKKIELSFGDFRAGKDPVLDYVRKQR